jgi:hypothetical protein
MTDERLFQTLATHAGPAAFDEDFEERLYSTLQREMRRGRAARASLLLAAVLVALLTITAALAIGSGLIEPPWVNPSLIPDPSADASPHATAEPSAGMIERRYFATATLLHDGTVLVAGGAQPPTPSTEPVSAERYDPSRGTWTATGNMVTPRYGHTATLLPDGTVLVVGGASFLIGSGLASAEVYHPGNGTWTPTGPMIALRARHTATLLPDGTVLVAGGGYLSDGQESLASAELYDPATGTWTATGNMITPHDGGHTATLLLDGTVLVAGNGRAERYDPEGGTWTATGNMITPHDGGHTATLLLDGTVLVVGGAGSPSAELYDPSHGTWTATGDMVSPRGSHTATLLPDGAVLVAGGSTSRDLTGTSVELYEPATRSWTAMRDMLRLRNGHTATLLPDGTLLVAGGTDPLSPFVEDLRAELYDPAIRP